MAKRVTREIVDELRTPETYLNFRRVHVHIDFLVRQIKKQQHDRKYPWGSDVAVGLVDRVKQKAVAHEPPVHENIDSVAVRPLHLGPRRKSADTERRSLQVSLRIGVCDYRRHGSLVRRNLGEFLKRLPPEKLIDTLGKGSDRRAVNDQL